jgi:multicomponent K+:H+ antiporter subunit E
MKRWLPAPLLSLALFGLWMALARSLEPAQILLAVVLAVGMPLWLRPLRPQAGPVRHPLVLARLILRVAADVVGSALDVTHGIVRMNKHPPRAGFVAVPLELRDEHALAALAMIVAVVPGTVWTELAPDRSTVLLHVFDLDDEAHFIARLKTRYEGPLKEIFE